MTMYKASPTELLQREHEIYPKALNQIASNMIRLKN